MKTHLFKALVVLFAIVAYGSTGNVRAESFGIKFLGNSTNDIVRGNACVVPVSGWTNIDVSTFVSGIIRSGDGTVSAALTRSDPGMICEWRNGSSSDGGNGSLLDGNDTMVNQSAVNVISNLIASSHSVYLNTGGAGIHPASNNPPFPDSGPAAGSFNGLHPESTLMAATFISKTITRSLISQAKIATGAKFVLIMGRPRIKSLGPLKRIVHQALDYQKT